MAGDPGYVQYPMKNYEVNIIKKKQPLIKRLLITTGMSNERVKNIIMIL